MPGKLAHGTKLYIGTGTPVTYTNIPNCGDFDYTPPQAEEVDVTDHTSTAREKIAGLGADGELTTDIHVDMGVAIHVTVRNLHGVTDPVPFQLRFPDTEKTQVAFLALISTKFKQPVGDAQVMSLALAISGSVTWGNWT